MQNTVRQSSVPGRNYVERTKNIIVHATPHPAVMNLKLNKTKILFVCVGGKAKSEPQLSLDPIS